MLIPVLGTPQGRNQLAWLLVRRRLCTIYFLSFWISLLKLLGFMARFRSPSSSKLAMVVPPTEFKCNVFQYVIGRQLLQSRCCDGSFALHSNLQHVFCRQVVFVSSLNSLCPIELGPIRVCYLIQMYLVRGWSKSEKINIKFPTEIFLLRNLTSGICIEQEGITDKCCRNTLGQTVS